MKTGHQNTLSKNEISRVLHAHQKDLLKYKVKKSVFSAPVSVAGREKEVI